ncbi:hypothetical protein WJX72_008258 [[Myrmecia] bisecta]|uniref:Tyr recombinase domain-containing protein n=1 Tax=[Myrmecia] bisecta TaxID=41462 RepID=A0AAW1R7U0_9CHLO
MGTLLREAGVPCDLTLTEGGKHTVTHHCKQYALNLAALCGVDYASIQWIASHERDVTRMHYLTLANDAIHKMGGFGPNWATQHTLGRAADCSALKQLLLPRLTAMIAAVQEDHQTPHGAVLTSRWLPLTWGAWLQWSRR